MTYLPKQREIVIIENPQEIIQELKNLGFGRVAEKIELFWGTPEFEEMFSSILINKDKGREGFPTHVFEKLLQLYHCHGNKFYVG